MRIHFVSKKAERKPAGSIETIARNISASFGITPTGTASLASKTTPRRVNRPLCIDDPEIERATVSKSKRQFETKAMKAIDDGRVVYCVNRCDATFDLYMGGNRLAVFVREVLVHGQMVVELSNRSALGKHLAVAYRLLDQSLHVIPGCAPVPYLPH